MSWAATRRPEEELDLVLGRPSAAGDGDQEQGRGRVSRLPSTGEHQGIRANTFPQVADLKPGEGQEQDRAGGRPTAAGEQGIRANPFPQGVDLASFPHGEGFEGWGLTGPADLARQEQARGEHQDEGISLQGEDRAGQGGQWRTAGLPLIVGALLDGWDWLGGGPAETDLAEATGPGTGNLAGHTFQNLQEVPSSRVEADLLMEGTAEPAAAGLGSQEAMPEPASRGARPEGGGEGCSLEEGPSSGVGTCLAQEAHGCLGGASWDLGSGHDGRAAPPPFSCLDLEEGLSSRAGTVLAEEAAQGAAGDQGGVFGVSEVPSPGEPARAVSGLAAHGSSGLTLEEDPGSEVLSPSGAFLRGFIAAGLRPSGAFVSQSAGLLSQARARARAFALLPGFGLGLDRAALPRRKARSGQFGVARE